MKKFYTCLLALAIFVFTSQAQIIRPEFPYTDGEVSAIVKYGNAIYIGGSFSKVIYSSGAVYPRNDVAAFDAITGAILPWDPKMSDDSYSFVTAMAAGNGLIYIGGFFGQIGSVRRLGLAAVNPITADVANWDPGELLYNNLGFDKIVPTASKIYLAGHFGRVGSYEQYDNPVVLDAVSAQQIHEFSSVSNHVSLAIALNANNLYLGGAFTNLDSFSRPNIAALNATTGAVLPWNPSANNAVQTLAVKDNVVYVGGSFTGFGYDPVSKTTATARNGIAALDGTTGAVLPWNPNVSGSSTFSVVRTIKVDGNNIYIGGNFNKVGNEIRNNIAIVDAISGEISLWNPNLEEGGGVRDILVEGNTVFVGGYFKTIAGQARPYFAALTAPVTVAVNCPAPITVSNAPGICGQFVQFAASATGSPSPTVVYRLGSKQITSPFIFPVGTSTVDVFIENITGAPQCSFTVTVNDTEAPKINNLSTNIGHLWPPDHKMKEMLVNYTVTDNCLGTIGTKLSVSSNEPADGKEPDWKIMDNHHIQLRAERSGKNVERLYTITLTATDQNGNVNTKNTTVTVPHNQSGKDGDQYGYGKFNHELKIDVQPNPSRNYFTLRVQSENTNQKIILQIYDVNGHLLETKNNITAQESVQMGKTLKPGFYILEYTQGTAKKQIRLVKQ
jgi:hypothetical protein